MNKTFNQILRPGVKLVRVLPVSKRSVEITLVQSMQGVGSPHLA